MPPTTVVAGSAVPPPPIPTTTSAGAAFWRSVLAVALGLGCVALAILTPQFRAFEAWSAEPLTGWVTRGGTHHMDTSATILFGLGTAGARGLRITPECSAAALVLPVLAVAAFLVGFGRRFSAGRVVLAAAGTCAVILLVNITRIALIAAATQRWGTDGYEASHLFVGSAISLVGFTTGMLVGFKILVSGDPVRDRLVDPDR